jgi:hypothetical protein
LVWVALGGSDCLLQRIPLGVEVIHHQHYLIPLIWISTYELVCLVIEQFAPICLPLHLFCVTLEHTDIKFNNQSDNNLQINRNSTKYDKNIKLVVEKGIRKKEKQETKVAVSTLILI